MALDQPSDDMMKDHKRIRYNSSDETMIQQEEQPVSTRTSQSRNCLVFAKLVTFTSTLRISPAQSLEQSDLGYMKW